MKYFIWLPIFFCLLLSTALNTSLVYDEVIYAPAGVQYWKTNDVGWNSEHPPLHKYISSLLLLTQPLINLASIPSRTMDAWRMGYLIYFESPTSAKKLILLARIPTILLSIILAIVIFLWTKRLTGQPAAFIAASTFVLDPLIIANSALAMNDMFVTAFIFFSVFSFIEKKWALTGLFTGLAICSKLTGILLLPGFLIIMVVKNRKSSIIWAKDNLVSILIMLSVALLAIIGVYIHHPKGPLQLFHSMLMLKDITSTSSSLGFLLKPISAQSTWFYYPIALLIKTPIPILLLWVLSCWIIINRNIQKNNFLTIIVLPILTFLAALIVKNQFGVRYLLPALPFLAVIVGIASTGLRTRVEKICWWSLIAWAGIECLYYHPYHMSYFNQLVGGPSQGYRWLDGSNQDWGQDLPTLAKFLKKNPGSVLLGYNGSNKPEAWDITYQDVLSPAITNSFRKEWIQPVDVKKEYLVLSARLRRDETYQWIQDRKPIAFLGYTLFVYDISTDVEAAREIAKIYLASNRLSLFERQRERVRLLNPLLVTSTFPS